MLTLDLGPETEQRLNEACRERGFTPSELIQRNLSKWLDSLDTEDTQAPDPYELGKDLFGTFGPAEAPKDPLKRQIWEYLHAKHRAG